MKKLAKMRGKQEHISQMFLNSLQVHQIRIYNKSLIMIQLDGVQKIIIELTLNIGIWWLQ